MKNEQLLLGVAVILVLFYFILQGPASATSPPREIIVVQRPRGVGAPFGYGIPSFRRRRFGPRRRRWLW